MSTEDLILSDPHRLHGILLTLEKGVPLERVASGLYTTTDKLKKALARVDAGLPRDMKARPANPEGYTLAKDVEPKKEKHLAR